MHSNLRNLHKRLYLVVVLAANTTFVFVYTRLSNLTRGAATYCNLFVLQKQCDANRSLKFTALSLFTIGWERCT